METSQDHMDKPLPDEVKYHLLKADGYLDLSMPDQAATELGQIPRDYRDQLVSRQLELRLEMVRQDWSRAASIADHLCKDQPTDPGNWIQYGYALRRCKGIPSARDVLKRAESHFPTEAIFAFNLACYACQEEHMDEARNYLKRAFKLDPKYREVALDDEDLRPLWSEIEP